MSVALCKGTLIRNPRNVCLWNPENEIFLLVESGILGFGIRNRSQGIRNPNLRFETEIQAPVTKKTESGIQHCPGFPFLGLFL